ncbi:OLC1v1028478C1 [Oldenlandia corymbosa var. corymbosa]|uniref:OLC1v1028478C1 n=1 Tax=Oldenlandia corymbosa var. corymbosa TaxID=529605 RepID=A0AAV1CDL5_OLDCO|nr:OLC1v1028478C1 [Oldenlandia corymbosa var. corymbosa]
MPTRKPPPPPSPASPSIINGGFATARSSSLPSSAGGRQVLPLQQQNSNNHHHRKGSLKPTKLFRRVRSVFKSLPIMTTPCKMPNMPTIGGGGGRHDGHHNIHGGKQMTGTLFGYRKCRVNLALQESPRSLPILILELSINTGKLLHDMGLGLVRIALECEKRHPSEKIKLVDEPIWTMYCNGRKVGYAVKREPTDEDVHVIQLLQAVSMGAGVLPSGDHTRTSSSSSEGGGGELTYLRACFERMVGSKDSETYYMMNLDSNSGPELSIFFVRV